jgi:hypothetical protein
MAELKSMKLSKSDQKKDNAIFSPSSSMDKPKYPYGLEISLDEAALKKLGIDLPEVGAEMALEAVVEVSSTSQSESAAGGKNRSLRLQITEMCLSKAGSKSSAESKLYNKEG